MIQQLRKTTRKSASYITFAPLVVFLIFLAAFIIGISKKANCQQVWGLSQCIGHAVENNIALNQKAIDVQSQKINNNQSWFGLLPELNAGSTVNFNFGRNVDPNDNSITFDQTLSNSYWVQASVNIFNGLVQVNTIAYNKFLLEAEKQGYQVKKNVLINNVINAYYTVVYTNGLRNVAYEQYVVSQNQAKAAKAKHLVGNLSPVTVQELLSQQAADKLELTRAQNNYDNALLNLKQILRIDNNSSFIIDTLLLQYQVIDTLTPAKPDVNKIVGTMPDVKQQEYLLNASQKNLNITKGGVLPRIYVGGGFYTGYYDANRPDSETVGFNNQLSNNQNQVIEMGVVIPIFNKGAVYSNYKRKQLAVKAQQLELQNSKDVVYAQIIKTMQDAQCAENELKASHELMLFSELSFKQNERMLQNGLISTTDFDAAKQRYSLAKANYLKNRLLFIMYNQLLTFYINGNWEHVAYNN